MSPSCFMVLFPEHWKYWDLKSLTTRGRCRTYSLRTSRALISWDATENAIINTCKMKKVFTAEQISDWFTSGTKFANIKLTDEVVGKKIEESSSSKEPRWDQWRRSLR